MKWMLALLIALAPLARAFEWRQVELSLQVPDKAWTLSIDTIYQVDNELYVISRVSRDPEVMGAAVISTVKDTIRFPTDDPKLPLKHYVIGKTWNWANKEPVTFIKDFGELWPKISTKAVQVYQRPPPPDRKPGKNDPGTSRQHAD